MVKWLIIGGCGRSGTNLLIDILSAHPKILAIPFETCAFVSYNDPNDKAFKMNVLEHSIRLANITGQMLCEKTPKNVTVFGDILNHFKEDVKIIHLIRDGRDVVTSRHPGNKDGYWIATNRWVDDVTKGLEFENHPQVLTIKYEDLVTKFNEVMCKISQFTSLETYDWNNWHNDADMRETMTIGEKKIQPITKAKIGRWNKPEHAENMHYFNVNEDAVKLNIRLGYQD